MFGLDNENEEASVKFKRNEYSTQQELKENYYFSPQG